MIETCGGEGIRPVRWWWLMQHDAQYDVFDIDRIPTSYAPKNNRRTYNTSIHHQQKRHTSTHQLFTCSSTPTPASYCTPNLPPNSNSLCPCGSLTRVRHTRQNRVPLPHPAASPRDPSTPVPATGSLFSTAAALRQEIAWNRSTAMPPESGMWSLPLRSGKTWAARLRDGVVWGI